MEHRKYSHADRRLRRRGWASEQCRIRTPRSDDRCPGRTAIYSHPCSLSLSFCLGFIIEPAGSHLARLLAPFRPHPYPSVRSTDLLCATGSPAGITPDAPRKTLSIFLRIKTHFHVILYSLASPSLHKQ